MTRDDGSILHLTDTATPPSRLQRQVAKRAMTRDLSSGIVRWRTVHELRRRRPAAVMAWSERSRQVAEAAGVEDVFYRPEPHVRVRSGRALPLCHSAQQAAAMNGIEVPEPVVLQEDERPEDGVFRWLLADDAGPHADLSLAVWAGVLMYVLMRRRGKTHRLVLPTGDAFRLRQARRFADQLGMPDLIEPWHDLPSDRAAARCDAALFTPKGPCDVRPIRLAALHGLPIAATASPDVREGAGEGSIIEASSRLPRNVTQAMLKVADRHETPRPVPSAGIEANVARASWYAAVRCQQAPRQRHLCNDR